MSINSTTVEPFAVERGDVERTTALQRVSWMLLLATLLLLPYEYWLPQLPVGRFTVTTLEAVWALAVLTWLASLAFERRRPHVPNLIMP